MSRLWAVARRRRTPRESAPWAEVARTPGVDEVRGDGDRVVISATDAGVDALRARFAGDLLIEPLRASTVSGAEEER